MSDRPSVLWVLDQDGWLEHYDPDGGDPAVDYPTGTYGVTTDPARALRFANASSALRCWSQTSTRTPVRPDGEPNRPLTKFSVEVQNAPLEE
jgi:hypothetical protein